METKLAQLLEARAELEARINAEQEHNQQVMQLQEFVKAHPLLVANDLYIVGRFMKAGGFKRPKDKVDGRGKGPDEATRQAFADAIKQAREDKGLSTADLADKIGINYTMINKWEHGAIPRGDNMKKLAKALGVDLAAIVANGANGAAGH